MPCIKLPIKLSKQSLSLSNKMNFSSAVTTTELVNSRYSCLAWLATAAHRIFYSYTLWISLLALVMLGSALQIISDDDRHTKFFTTRYFNGNLSLIFAINFITMVTISFWNFNWLLPKLSNSLEQTLQKSQVLHYLCWKDFHSFLNEVAQSDRGCFHQKKLCLLQLKMLIV